MRRFLANLDGPIVMSVLVLLTLGLATVKSVAPDSFSQQLMFSLAGLAVLLLTSQLDFEIFKNLAPVLYLLSLTALVSTIVFGAITRGSARWLQLGGITLQPSELVRPLLVLALAAFFLTDRQPGPGFLFKQFVLIFIPFFLIFRQPDLGSSLVVFSMWLGMLPSAGFSNRLLLLVCLVLGLIFPIGWQLLADYQQERVLTFFDPFRDPLGSGYNMIQAMIAVGSGRFWGRGLGHGTQSHLQFLPERQSDFIFASFAEEFGFLGSLLMILLYLLLFWRLLYLAGKTPSRYGRLVCLGVFGMLFFQTFVNIGMNLGLVPITGITLPLVSTGGSSMIASLASLGLVAGVGRSEYPPRGRIR